MKNSLMEDKRKLKAMQMLFIKIFAISLSSQPFLGHHMDFTSFFHNRGCTLSFTAGLFLIRLHFFCKCIHYLSYSLHRQQYGEFNCNMYMHIIFYNNHILNANVWRDVPLTLLNCVVGDFSPSGTLLDDFSLNWTLCRTLY